MSEKKMRLNTFIAHAGITSRRKADDLIVAGKVKVNGKIITTMGVKVDVGKDVVMVDDKQAILPPQHVYYLVYKPLGYVSTVSDEKGRKTVTELVPDEPRVYPVGRLDMDSEGLMILTNDGEMSQKLTHPSNHMPKTYRVLIDGRLNNNQAMRLKQGLRLKNFVAMPAEFRQLERVEEGSWLEITIAEGKNRQVRRMMQALGFECLRLIRVAIGPLTLDDLGEEKVVILNEEQIGRLR